MLHRHPIAAAAIVAALLTAACEQEADTTETETTETIERTTATVMAPDGVEIAYENAGSGEPAIVFVHGWSCDRTYWENQIDHFAGSHQVVAIDLGGHGESGMERDEWTMESYGADVAAVIEDLGLQDVVLVGHSMGGPVILETARLLPDRVAALVSVDYFHDVSRPLTPEEREAFVRPMEDGFAEATEPFVRGMFGANADSALVDRIAKDMAAGPPEVGISAMNHIVTYDDAAKIAAATVPIRMINADLWPTNLEAARQHDPDIGLAVVPAVGHFIMLEDPEEFNRQLEDAVRDLAMAAGNEGQSQEATDE